MSYHSFYHTMADGTVKQVNPFTGVEVWSVPGRGNKPLGTPLLDQTPVRIKHQDAQDFCAFCKTRYFETAPEKSRVVKIDGVFETYDRIDPSDYFSSQALFRRVSNLFEILSVPYWRRNYNYRLSKKNLQWKERYMAGELGLRHVLDILDFKMKRSGKSDEDIDALSMDDKLVMADSLFGGGHEMIIVEPHYRADAKYEHELYATADMSDEEHFHYYNAIIAAMNDIVENNRYVRHLSVFKNWLRPAGATFDHLHTQIVAIDEWGASTETKIRKLVQDKNVYNTYGPNFAGHHNLVFAENEHAIALAGIGHRYPTVEIFSKSPNARPTEHEPEETRGVSDLVRAVHSAIGGDTSVNEEWHHTPVDSLFKMPWHVFIKLRINTPAGFEGGTNIFINPMIPTELRDRMVSNLYELREQKRIAQDICIAEECNLLPNPLQYVRNA